MEQINTLPMNELLDVMTIISVVIFGVSIVIFIVFGRR